MAQAVVKRARAASCIINIYIYIGMELIFASGIWYQSLVNVWLIDVDPIHALILVNPVLFEI